MIDSSKLENKAVKSKFEVHNFKPRDLLESIEWHEYALIPLKEREREAIKASREYQQRLVDEEFARRKADRRATMLDEPVMANMIFFDRDDPILRKLEDDRSAASNERARMEYKITKLKNRLLLHGNEKYTY